MPALEKIVYLQYVYICRNGGDTAWILLTHYHSFFDILFSKKGR